MSAMSTVIFAPAAIALGATTSVSPIGTGEPFGRCWVPGGGWRSWLIRSGCMTDTGGVAPSLRP